MKKTGIALLSAFFAFSTASMAAETLKAAVDAPSIKAKPVAARSSADQKKMEEIRKNIESKKIELNGSKWELTANSSDPKMKGQKDTFVFQDGVFRSEALSKRGFSPTNYTVSVASPDSETAVWETMQSGKEGLVFIRGEWEKNRMSVNVTEQLDGGKKVNEYSYQTSARTPISANSKGGKEGSVSAPATPSEKVQNAALVSAETKTPIASQPIENKEVVESFIPGTTEEDRAVS